jgi:two-component system sensor histidine kinase ChvG
VSLRLQLLLFGLTTLVLPWTGLRYVRDMEGALRSGLEQSLLATATTVATTLEDQDTPLCTVPPCAAQAISRGTPIYAMPLSVEPSIDGVRSDDWNGGGDAPLTLPGGQRLYAGVYGRFAYLFVAVPDRDLVYQRVPGQMPYGDRVVLALEPKPGTVRWLLLNTAAPGAFRAQETRPERFEPTEAYDARVIGAWQETATGYSLEVRVPLNLIGGGLGVGVIGVDHAAGGDYTVALAATWDDADEAPGRFIYQRPELKALLGQFARRGGRFRILDADGWVMSAAGSVEPRVTERAATSLMGELFRWLLSRDDPPYPAERPLGRVADPALRAALTGRSTTTWYGSGPNREAIVAAAVPIVGPSGPRGAVLFEQASDPILTLTNRALVRLMTFTLLATVVVGLGLLGYATWLSLRVRRLAHAAETALGPHGELRTRMPGTVASDELGVLARSFTQLLERLREHTEYLRTLASKLSHELRTPLAVVTTSLDNLEHEVADGTADEYLKRLREGTTRLDAILAAMSEATQLEQAIQETVAEPVDLATVVRSCCGAYGDVYPQREIVYGCGAVATEILGSGELIAQLLDKLVDNAVSFSPAGSRIDVAITEEAGELLLSVANKGPTLPAKMRRQLFDSLVSIREQRGGRAHLGLGLHIVALVAAFHGGRCDADDLPDGSGVVFRVWFPRRSPQRY